MNGIVCAGEVIAGTEWVSRDPAAWWSWDDPKDRPDLRSRHGKPATLLVYHWTAGNCRMGPDAARRVVQAMRARRREDGSLMDVSVHFVVSWDGIVTQCADLGVATVHVGRGINERSIGVELCWPGTWEQAGKLEQQHRSRMEVRNVRGHRVECMAPSSEMLAAAVRLGRTLAPASLPLVPGRVEIPRVTAKTGMPIAGAGEHWCAPTTKIDAAGYVLDGLRADGWR